MNSNQRLINLLKGWPSPNLLPTAQIKAAANKALSDADISVPAILYGPDGGYGPLRQNLARWLTDVYQPDASIPEDRIIISGGASQNLACILQAFSDPAYTHIWMVSPTYHLACRIFEDGGFFKKLRAVPEDEEGIDIEALTSSLRKVDFLGLKPV